jgi:hypothetical protein
LKISPETEYTVHLQSLGFYMWTDYSTVCKFWGAAVIVAGARFKFVTAGSVIWKKLH